MQQTKTELHTHFLGMLSCDKLLEFIKVHTSTIFWPFDISKDKAIELPVRKMFTNKKCRKMTEQTLTVRHGERVKYSELDILYSNRRTVLDRIVESQPDYTPENSFAVKTRIYNEYLNWSLEELINSGVALVEISETNEKLIPVFKIKKELSDKIECRFLLGFSRNHSEHLKQAKKRAKQVELLLNCDQKTVYGIDIMGSESAMTKEELDYSNTANNSKSFKRKLEAFITTLYKYDNSILRIHAGETPESFKNPELTLQMIDELCDKHKISVPPPEIRLGHVCHFKETANYLRLLKKYGVIVEINASSNLALSNI